MIMLQFCILVVLYIRYKARRRRRPRQLRSAPPATAHDAAGIGGGKRRWCGDAAGAEGAARNRARSRCPHDRESIKFKECGGAGLCRYLHQRSTCKESGGEILLQ